MNINIPAETWGAMVGAAVMQSVTPENRDVLIQEAIRHLLTKDTSSFGGGRSPLQKAFDEAVYQEAKTQVAAFVGSQLTEAVESVVRESLVKAFDGERKTKLVENIADAIVKAFRVEDRY